MTEDSCFVRLRKDVNVYLFDPAKRYFHVVIELENVSGALKAVLDVVHGLNLNVLGSFSSVDTAAKVGVWSGFIEDGIQTGPDLKRKLSASPYVHDIMVVESDKGFLVDGVHFPVAFNTGERAVMMEARALKNMLESVTEQFGSGGNVILYQEGRSYGGDVGSKYLARLGGDFITSNMGEALKLYQALGWFRVSKVAEGAGQGPLVIQAEENFECMGAQSKVPHSHFVRGHLEGVVSTWKGAPMECKETSCIAKGDKCCEFALSRRAA